MELRGHLDLLLLGTLHELRSAHGYALIVGLRQRSAGAFDLPEGTVYPALHRLERDGLVASEWATETGRRRRVYQLTPDGLAALTAKRQEWWSFAAGVEAIIGRNTGEALA